MDRPRPPRTSLPTLLLSLLVLASTAAEAAGAAPADDPYPDGLRIGMTLGGISLVGLSVEYLWGGRSVDVTLGTWSFRDVSLSVVAKQYLGPGGLRPYFGLGFWGVAAYSGEEAGSVLIVRAPIGVDWRIVPGHSLGAALNINRGLWVRRTDPTDETPLNRRLVPLPGFYYRWRP